MTALLLKIGSVDVSDFVRLQPGEGFDPGGPPAQSPEWLDSTFPRGKRLASVDVANREMSWPLHLKDVSKDAAHDLVQRLVRELSLRPLQVQWRDDGASDITYLDVEFARWEPETNFWRQKHNWLSGVLRIWTLAYGHTATSIVRATGAASSVLTQVSMASRGGDVGALLEVAVTPRAGKHTWGGRTVGIAPLPNASYVPFIPAASLLRVAVATLVGAAGAPGSQVVLTRKAATYGGLFDVALSPASAYHGDNRILGVLNPNGRTIGGIAAYAVDGDSGDLLGPTQVIGGFDGYQLVDLGVKRVDGAGAATQTFRVGGGLNKLFAGNVDGDYAGQAATQAGQFGGILVVPEGDTALLRDDDFVTVGHAIFGGTGMGTIPLASFTDDFGNPFVMVGGGVAGASGYFLALAAATPPPATHVGQQVGTLDVPAMNGGRIIAHAITFAGSGSLNLEWFNDDLNVDTFVRLFYDNANDYMTVGAKNALGSIAFASAGILNNNLFTAPLYLELSWRDDLISGRAFNYNAPGESIASIGVIATGARNIRAKPRLLMANAGATIRALASRGPIGLVDFKVQKIGQVGTTADCYEFDGVSDRVRRFSPGSQVAFRDAALRGGIPELSPSAPALVAFAAYNQGGTLDDNTLDVEVRVREQFYYAN